MNDSRPDNVNYKITDGWEWADGYYVATRWSRKAVAKK